MKCRVSSIQVQSGTAPGRRNKSHEARAFAAACRNRRPSGAGVTSNRQPAASELSSPTHVGVPRVSRDDLPVTQRQILVALARPFRHNEFAAPASNSQIAEELHLSVDAVKAHLRMLFQRFGIEDLPPNQKRSRLVAEALQSGIVSQREL